MDIMINEQIDGIKTKNIYYKKQKEVWWTIIVNEKINC